MAAIHETYAVEGGVLDIGAPVEVGRASGHFWFPTLHAFTPSEVLCEVVLADDKPQGKWPACLCHSRDGGATWTRALEIPSYGPSSLRVAPDRILLMPYELWPVAPGDRRNAAADGTLVHLGGDGALSTETVTIRFLGFPADLCDYFEGELCVVTNGNILPLADGSLFTTVYGRVVGEDHYTTFAMVSRDGGYTWHYRSVVASPPDTPGAPEGPDESNTVRLADGRLMCLYRVGSGRPWWYHRSLSADEGATWTRPEPVAGTWSVEPQLARLENGLLLLSGGRPGLFLWVCTDGEGRRWGSVNLAEHHNAHVAEPAMRFTEGFCRADDPPEALSTSYTSIAVVGPDEALVCYDRLANGWAGAPGPHGDADAVFTVPVRGRR